MEFKGIDKEVNSSHSVTFGNTKYSTYHMTEHPQQQTVLNYSTIGVILVFLIVCIVIVVYRK
nr:MAG TPA: hypothetical protein [Caudoviricetes sp.]